MLITHNNFTLENINLKAEFPNLDHQGKNKIS